METLQLWRQETIDCVMVESFLSSQYLIRKIYIFDIHIVYSTTIIIHLVSFWTFMMSSYIISCHYVDLYVHGSTTWGQSFVTNDLQDECRALIYCMVHFLNLDNLSAQTFTVNNYTTMHVCLHERCLLTKL